MDLVDLLNLENSVFDVHEEIFDAENALFSLNTRLDDIMAQNPKAKEDGVFRGILAPELCEKGSKLEDFWRLFGGIAKERLQAQFLKSEDRNSFVMENTYLKVRSQTAFEKACRHADMFHPPKPTCCTQVLEDSGPKAAVKHFYGVLQLKSTVVERQDPLEQKQQDKYMKKKYDDRQKVLQRESDPLTKCAIVEASMRSRSYAVTETANPTAVDIGRNQLCKCHRCHMSTQSGSIPFKLEDSTDDGDGQNCSLYFNGIEESQERFQYITPHFALAHLCHLNMLTDLDSYYPGISFPFVYLGGLHSFFPIHVEDMSLWSINYLHMGSPKLIIVVAPCDILKLSLVLTSYGLSNLHRNCLFKLSHKSTVVFPQLLVHHKIKFKIIFQKPGDFIFFCSQRGPYRG